MKFFDFFNKKENNTAKTEQISESRQLTKDDLLNIVCEKYNNCVLKNEMLYFSDYDLTMKIDFGSMNNHNGQYCIQMFFILNHPYFDEPIIESCAGIGNSKNNALKMGLDSFCASVLTFLLGALKCDGENEISAEVMGKKAVFRVPCTRGTFHMGEDFAERIDLWELIKADIKEYLGIKKVYWIKLFASQIGNESSFEVRINNIVYPELTKKLVDLFPKPEQFVKYATYKQFIVLIQKESTYIPCPYDKKQVQNLVYSSIEKIQTINSQEKYESVMKDIIYSCPIKSLGIELRTLIPEIYCQIILRIPDSDSVLIHNIDTNETIDIKKSQLRSYGYIEDAVYNYISNKNPTKEQNLSVLSTSSRFDAVNQAVSNGAKIEDLTFSSLLYNVEKGYELW